MLLLSSFSLLSIFFSELLIFSSVVLLIFFFLSQGKGISGGLNLDDISINLVLLSFLVGGMIMSTSSTEKGSFMPPLIFFSLLIVIIFFLTDNLIIFFMTLEMSLIPLMLLILGWGRQVERLVASQFLVLFTIIASSPLFFSIIFLSGEGSSSISWLTFNPSSPFSYNIILLLGLLSFLVKIPSYLVHSWLPKAHVEAPLEGSMILAGLMLKVGMYGLMRFYGIFSISEEILLIIFSMSFIGCMVSFIVALSSDDMKMSVAFSSISHMNLIIAAFSSIKWSGGHSSLIIMLAHGVSSPLLFYLVTSIYQLSGSRSVLISKGIYSKIPVLWMVGLMMWTINFSAPPFLPFTGELMAFNSIFPMSSLTPLWMFLTVVISSFFSMVNFGTQSHSSFKMTMKGLSENYSLIIFSFSGTMVLFLLFMFGLFY